MKMCERFFLCPLFCAVHIMISKSRRLPSDQPDRAQYTGGKFRFSGIKFMDYKNDNRTPRDRITGEFLSELLFTDLGGDSCCDRDSLESGNCSCNRQRTQERQSVRASAVPISGCKANSLGKVRDGSCNNVRRDCRSDRGNVELTGNYSLVMAYVQMQEFSNLYDIEQGFCEGTIFKDLRFPFYPTPCRKELC